MEFRSAERAKKIDFCAMVAGAALIAAGMASEAQTADQAWLRHNGGQSKAAIPVSVRALSSDLKEQSAVRELERGISGLAGAKPDTDSSKGETVVGTLDEVRKAFPTIAAPAHLGPHGFWLKRTVW